MTTFNTGKPVGSSDPRDLYDNAENLDVLVNSPEKLDHADRLGVSRKTWHGMEQAFQEFLLRSGYQDIGPYAADLEITARNQIFLRGGEYYRAGASLELPYMTTGDWVTESESFVSVGDASLRQDLALGIATIGGQSAQSVAELRGDLVQPVATFDNVQEMQGSEGLVEGRKARTLGYYEAGDGGGADYAIVAESTSIEDGGAFINLPGSVKQARAIFAGHSVSVRQFGANPDLADNSTHFNNAANAINISKIYIPEGRYSLQSKVEWNGKVLAWEGAGRSLTKLIWTTLSSGFSFGQSTPVDSVEISGISFLTRASNSEGAAIEGWFNPNVRPSPVISDIFVAGEDASGELSAANWFYRGVHLINAMQPIIKNSQFIGATGSNQAELSRAEAAVRLEATEAAVIPKIDRCHSLNYAHGVYITSSSTPSIEGIYITNCDFVFVNSGVRIAFSSGGYYPPQIVIANCHSEAMYRAIDITHVKELNITDCTLYAFNSDEPASLIHLFDVDQGTISGNFLIGRPNNTSTEGIWIENCTDIGVFDNNIATVDSHIAIVGSSTDCQESRNTFRGTGARTADVSTGLNRVGYTQDAESGSEWTGAHLEQWGSTVVQLDSTGRAVINFPRPFPNVAQTVIATNGDSGSSVKHAIPSNKNTSSFTVLFPDSPSQSVRVNWWSKGY